MAAAPEQARRDSTRAGRGGEQQGGGAGAVAEPRGPTVRGALALQPRPGQSCAPPAPVPGGAGRRKISTPGASGRIILMSVCGRAHARRICLQSK